MLSLYEHDSSGGVGRARQYHSQKKLQGQTWPKSYSGQGDLPSRVTSVDETAFSGAKILNIVHVMVRILYQSRLVCADPLSLLSKLRNHFLGPYRA